MSVSRCERESHMDVTAAVIHVTQVRLQGGSRPFPAVTPPSCPAQNNTTTSECVESNMLSPTDVFASVCLPDTSVPCEISHHLLASLYVHGLQRMTGMKLPPPFHCSGGCLTLVTKPTSASANSEDHQRKHNTTISSVQTFQIVS